MRTAIIAPPRTGTGTKLLIVAGWLLVALTIFYCLLYALPLAMGGDCSYQVFTQGYCGSKSGIVLGTALLLWPLAVIIAVVRPMLFPVGIYFFALPFDELTNLNHVGSINKVLGILSVLAIVFVMFRHRRVLRPSVALAAWIAFTVWAGTSLFWSIVPAADNSHGPMLATTLLELVLLYAVLSITPLKEAELRVLTGFLLAGATLASIVGIYMFRHGGALEQLLVNRKHSVASVDFSAQIDFNQVGASLMLPWAFATMGVLGSRWGWKRVGFLAMFGIIMLAMYITKSRGMFVGMVAMLAWFWLYSRFRLQTTVIALITVVATFSASLFKGQAIWERFTQDQSGGSGRVDIWKVGLAAFKQHFLVGAGFGNFPFAYDQAFIHVFQRNYMWWNRGSHDVILWVGVELGIVGLALMFWALWKTFRSLQIVPRVSRLYDMRITLEGALFGLMVSSLFLDTLLEKYVWITFAMIAMVRNVYLYAPDSDRAIVEAAARPQPRAVIVRPPVLQSLPLNSE